LIATDSTGEVNMKPCASQHTHKSEHSLRSHLKLYRRHIWDCRVLIFRRNT